MKTQNTELLEILAHKLTYISGKAFTKNQLNEILKKSELSYYNDKESVTDILDEEYIFIIVDGAFRYYIKPKEQEEQILRLSYPSDILIQCDTISTDKTQIKAINKCALLKVKIDHIYTSEIDKKNFIISLSDKARKRIMEDIFISTLSIEERYMKMLNDHKDIVYKIPSKYIASSLGIIESSFCRMKKRVLKRHCP